MKTNQQETRHTLASPSVIEIELLALDLKSCTRCLGTLEHVGRAIEILEPVLEVTDIRVNVSRLVVETEEQARRHRFVSSPTVWLNGKDIAFETLESECKSCTDLCGCDEGTNCRIWRYRGEEHTEEPVGLIVESILREIFGQSADSDQPAPASNGVPENLRRFFRSKSGAPVAARACCSDAEQESCCAPGHKADCCGDAKPETCGCQ